MREVLVALIMVLSILAPASAQVLESSGAVLKGARSPTGPVLISNISSGPDRGGCYGEDSYHERLWEGTLSPQQSFDVSLTFCGEPYTAGASGFVARVWGKGELDLAITSPSGTHYPAHVLEKYPPQDYASRCFTGDLDWYWWGPPYNNWVGSGTPIESGDWLVRLSNLGRRNADVTLEIRVDMMLPGIQQTFCPPEDLNGF